MNADATTGADAAGDGDAGRGPTRVVVCDDHPVVRQGLRSFLEAQGFTVVGEAADGAEAARVVAEQRPDVLLTDLVMAGVDGIEAIRRIRASGQAVGILVLTSFGAADQVIPAIRAGADGYLSKGASKESVLQAIKDVSQGRAVRTPFRAGVDRKGAERR